MIVLALRGLQLTCACLALAKLFTSFFMETSGGQATMLGSHETRFAMLATHTASLYASFHLVVIEILAWSPQFAQKPTVIMDGIVGALLLAAYIALVSSDYVVLCDAYGFLLECGNLMDAAWLSAAAAGSFFASATLYYAKPRFLQYRRCHEKRV